MMNNPLDDIYFFAVNETEICHANQDVEITFNIEKGDGKEVSDTPTLNKIASERVMLPETIVFEESVSCENYRNKDGNYTKCTNPVVKDKHFEIVSSTSSTNNDTGKVSVNKLQQDQKSQPTNNYTFEQIENELLCAICTELFIKVTTLNCSHSFCKDCIKEWRKRNKKCPICRTEIKTANPTIVLDNFIGKILKSAPDDVRQHHNEVVTARKKSHEGAARTRSVPPIKIRRTRFYYLWNGLI